MWGPQAEGNLPMPTLAPAWTWPHPSGGQYKSGFYYTLVQTSLECLPRAYLNSLAPMKPGTLHAIQTGRQLAGFEKLLKNFISDFTVLLS